MVFCVGFLSQNQNPAVEAYLRNQRNQVKNVDAADYKSTVKFLNTLNKALQDRESQGGAEGQVQGVLGVNILEILQKSAI